MTKQAIARDKGDGPRLAAGLLAFIGVLVFVSALINFPTETRYVLAWPHAALSAEIVLLFAALAVFPSLRGRWALTVRYAASVAILAVVVLKLGDMAAHAALGRPFNLYFDIHLSSSVVALLRGALGDSGTATLLAALTFGAVALAAASFLTIGAIQRLACRPAGRAVILGATAVATVLLAGQRLAPDLFGPVRPVIFQGAATAVNQARLFREARAEQAAFARTADQDGSTTFSDVDLAAALDGVDVLLIFVESYGRSAIENPRYGATLVPTLDRFSATLDAAGVASASGWLESPVQGGQSWLAHGTLLSGLWLESQLRYNLMIGQGRQTLVHDFARAGYRTVAAMPAITLAWPEAESFGYAQTYFADDFGYAGPPYNWVTMPDQYTLAFLQRAERTGRPAGTPPLFAEVALISSHAPWTPVPELIEDWSTIGNGAIFDRWIDRGEPPGVVWADPDKIRTQYVLSVDYSLQVLERYAADFVNEETLLIVVGDHQPAPVITGEGASRAVPLHILSGDRRLVDRFIGGGLTPGMRPDPGSPVPPMDRFRGWFLSTLAKPLMDLGDAAVSHPFGLEMKQSSTSGVHRDEAAFRLGNEHGRRADGS